MDGAAFPRTIKVKYTIDGKDYICRKWIGAGNKVPDKGTTIKVTYCEDKPSKAIVELWFNYWKNADVLHTWKAVSYTHLDVYKRQIKPNIEGWDNAGIVSDNKYAASLVLKNV